MSKLPKLDFSGLLLEHTSSSSSSTTSGDDQERWNLARAQVMEALETYGAFEPFVDEIWKPDLLLDELFGPVMDELFGVPQEAKLRNLSDKPYQGFIGKRPGSSNYESLNVDEASRHESFQSFASMLWPPYGNPNFCDKAWGLAKKMSKLELAIRKMVVEGLGVQEKKYFLESMAESSSSMMQTMRMARYDSPVDQETMIAIGAHTDMNLVTIICQRQAEGLEVRSRSSGEWIHAAPDTCTVMIGESFEAWSNGRVKATVHRVRMTSNETRHAIGFGSQFRYGHTIEAPRELFDEMRPLLYTPYDYGGYLDFRFSKAGLLSQNPLKDYCGAPPTAAAAAAEITLAAVEQEEQEQLQPRVCNLAELN